jgi:predicted O-methyltransferase YrrM
MSPELLDYLEEMFAPGDEELQALTAAAKEFGMPANWEITHDVGRLFQVFCRAVGARRVLEFGTLAGHSALWLARALPADGQVVSIEFNPDYAAFARAQLAKTRDGYKVDVRIGAAWDSLPALEAEVHDTGRRYDVIFLDADKARYPDFLEWSERVLRPGGMVLADNVLRCGSWNGQTLLDPVSDDPRILAMRRFNATLAHHPRFTAMIVPIRAGIAVGVYTP